MLGGRRLRHRSVKPDQGSGAPGPLHRTSPPAYPGAPLDAVLRGGACPKEYRTEAVRQLHHARPRDPGRESPFHGVLPLGSSGSFVGGGMGFPGAAPGEPYDETVPVCHNLIYPG